MQFEWNLLLADMQKVIRSFCYDTTAEILLGLTCQRELAILLSKQAMKEQLFKEKEAWELETTREMFKRLGGDFIGFKTFDMDKPMTSFLNVTIQKRSKSMTHFLDLALTEGHLRFVKWSLAGYEARGENPFVGRKSRYFEAIKGGHLDLLKWLVKEGYYRPLQPDQLGLGYTGLFWASYSGQLSILHYLGKLMQCHSTDSDIREKTSALVRGAVLHERLNALSWLQVRGYITEMDTRSFDVNEKIPLASQRWLSERGLWRVRKEEEGDLKIISLGPLRNYAQ